MSRTLVAAAVAGSALMMFGASSASATDATWTPSGVVNYEGDLTVELDGGSPVLCADVEFTGSVFANITALPFTYDRWWDCENGQILAITNWWGGAHVDDQGAYWVEIGFLEGTSPFGSYWGTATMDAEDALVPFVNASGGAPSRLMFSDTVIGWRSSDRAPVSLTGSLEVTPSSGSGTVTLVP